MPTTMDIIDLLAQVRSVADSAREAAPSMPARATLHRLIAALPVAALVADNHGRFVAVNEDAAALTGYTVQELLHLSVWQITPGMNEHDAESLWRAFLSRGEQHGSYQVLGRGGRIINATYAAMTDVLPGFHVSVLQPAPPSPSVNERTT